MSKGGRILQPMLVQGHSWYTFVGRGGTAVGPIRLSLSQPLVKVQFSLGVVLMGSKEKEVIRTLATTSDINPR